MLRREWHGSKTNEAIIENMYFQNYYGFYLYIGTVFGAEDEIFLKNLAKETIMSKNIKFSIGYNYMWSEFRQLLAEYGSWIESVYFPLPRRLLGSGRGSLENTDYAQDVRQIMLFCRENNIRSILLLNPNILDYSRIPSIMRGLRELDAFAPIESVVVKDPYLLKTIKAAFPHISLEVSILAHVNTRAKARYWSDLGAETVAVDRDQIRNIELIEKMCHEIRVKVLINEGCMKDGIFCDMHYNYLSEELNYRYPLSVNAARDLREAPCLMLGAVGPEKIFSAPFVRPEDLKYYLPFTDSFKLSTRNANTFLISNTLRAYRDHSYTGNLLDLLNSPFTRVVDYIDNKALDRYDFFRKVSSCDDDCRQCGFCRQLLAKVQDIDPAIAALGRLQAAAPEDRFLRKRHQMLVHLKRRRATDELPN